MRGSEATSRGRATIAFAATLGAMLAILALVVHARLRRAASEPGRRASLAAVGAAVADDAGPLREVLLHYVAELEPMFAATYRGFLASLPRETRLVLVVRRGERARLDAFLARTDASLAARARVVEIDASLGIWSKDRALVLAPSEASKRIELLVPPRPRPGEGSRASDWDIVPSVVAALRDRFEVRQVPIAFDAGDFAIAGDRVLFDVNLYARNRTRGYRSPEELRDRVRALVGRDVVMLGAREGDVPRHHMSMYMAPLAGGVALVGDPEAGARIVGRDYAPGERSVETSEPLRAHFSPETQARFDRAARDLSAAGFRVVRIPTVPFEDRTYFAYTNGVYETRDGARTAWMPAFGEPALDDAARAVYEALGWRVVPVPVRAMYAHHGTLGCVVNVLARG